MGCYVALRKDEAVMQAATRMNLENVVRSERSQEHNVMCCVTPCRQNIQNRQIHGGRTQIGGC